MKIIITGGSGFVGSKLSKALVKKGHAVFNASPKPPVKDIEGVSFIPTELKNGEIPDIFSHCDAIVHLAGVSIFNRWTTEYKKMIIGSRVKTAEAIHEFLQKSGSKPKVFVSASAVGYYGDGGENELVESAANGDDFLAEVCRLWEQSAQSFETLGMRSVSVRTAIVLGPGGGMMSKVVPLFKWGIGGKMGNGKQWFSWIHIDDLVRVYELAIENGNVSGAINASAPGVLRNKDFARAMGRALKRPSIVPAPGFALRIALGEFAKAVLSSQKTAPAQLHSSGFSFNYPDIDSALNSIFKKD